MDPRAAQHGRRRYGLLLEAVCMLGVAAVAVRFLPFKQAVRLGSVRIAGPPCALESVGADTSRAVRSAARLAPWRTACIEQGIALQRMLRRRGIDAALHYGIANDDGGELAAHVWVAAGDTVLIGGAAAAQFHRVATFP